MNAKTPTGAPSKARSRKPRARKPSSKTLDDRGVSDNEEEEEESQEEDGNNSEDAREDELDEGSKFGSKTGQPRKGTGKPLFKGNGSLQNENDQKKDDGEQAGGTQGGKSKDEAKHTKAETAPGAIPRIDEVKDLKKQLKKVLNKYKYRRLQALPGAIREQPEGDLQEVDDSDINEESFETSLGNVESQMAEVAPLPVQVRADALQSTHERYQKAIKKAQETVVKNGGGGFLLSVAGGLALRITKGSLDIVDLGKPDPVSDPDVTEVIATKTKVAPKAPAAKSKRAEELQNLLGNAMEDLGDFDINDEALLDTFDQYKALATYKFVTKAAPFP